MTARTYEATVRVLRRFHLLSSHQQCDQELYDACKDLRAAVDEEMYGRLPDCLEGSVSSRFSLLEID